jgi:hypothetical protein
MKNFILFILLFILAYTLIKAIFRLFTPFTKSSSENNEQYSFFRKKNKTNITFDDNNASKKQYDKNDGEYVDYEEVK